MRGLVGQGVKAVAAAADVMRPRRDGVAVLLYHRVGARTPVTVDLPTALFADQMAYLAARYRPISIDEAAAALGEHKPMLGPPVVVVTFDDGTVDFVEEALPVLVSCQIPAVVYVATDFVERGRSFPDNGRPLSWAGLAEALSTGLVTVGSHTHTHRLLDRSDATMAADELDRSVALIGQRLGVAVDHFAYPKALPGSAAAEAEVRRSFRTAALAGTRLNPWEATDLHRLARIPVQRTDGFAWFRRKVDGGLGLEDRLRQVVNRRRYAEATT